MRLASLYNDRPLPVAMDAGYKGVWHSRPEVMPNPVPQSMDITPAMVLAMLNGLLGAWAILRFDRQAAVLHTLIAAALAAESVLSWHHQRTET